MNKGNNIYIFQGGHLYIPVIWMYNSVIDIHLSY